MTHHENLKLLVFVGLVGSGKSTAITYFTEHKYPHVSLKNTPVEDIVKQIDNLANAGQHRIVIDNLRGWTEYKELKKEFPGEIVLTSIIAPRHIRYHRLSLRESQPMTSNEAYESDISGIEEFETSGPIAIAEHFILNDGSKEELHQRLAQLAQELEF